jgi:choline dehydrogenase-like flavoprotein
LNLVQVIGAGLAGCEAAFQAAEAGARILLHEMRHKRTPAHQTDSFGERVAAIHKERAGSFGAVATEARDAAPRFAADARGRGSASSRRTCAYRRSRCFLSRNSNAIESHPLISVQARRGRTDSCNRHRHHCDWTAHQPSFCERNQPHHRFQSALFFTTALVSSWRLIRSTYQSRFAHHDMEIPSIARTIT